MAKKKVIKKKVAKKTTRKKTSSKISKQIPNNLKPVLPHKTTKINNQTEQPTIEKPKQLNSQEILNQNLISLQKVLLTLSGKFDNLAKEMSRMLHLFEISAKEFSKSNTAQPSQEIHKKVDTLLDQNKTFAKGIALLHEPSQPITSQMPPAQRTIENPNINNTQEPKMTQEKPGIPPMPPINSPTQIQTPQPTQTANLQVPQLPDTPNMQQPVPNNNQQQNTQAKPVKFNPLPTN